MQYSVPLKPGAIEQHIPCPSVHVPSKCQSEQTVRSCLVRHTLAEVYLRPNINVPPHNGSPVTVPLEPEATERHVP